MSSKQPPSIDKLWTQHQRRTNSKTPSWACVFCPDRRIFGSTSDLWQHALLIHFDKLPQEESEQQQFRTKYELDSERKETTPRDEYQPRRQATGIPVEPPPTSGKRSLNLSANAPPSTSLAGLQELNIATPRGSDEMHDISDDEHGAQPRKRAALGDGISAGSGSPYRESSPSPPPRRSKARPTSGTLQPDTDYRQQEMFDSQRPVGKGQLWTPEHNTPLTRASFADPSNIASIQAQKSRAQQLQHKPRKSSQPTHQSFGPRPPNFLPPPNNPTPSGIVNRPAQNPQPMQARDDNYDIILQPETRPISQEQLVAEVKGIYAGLVMVEAKCIEVDNKQATLAQANPGAQPKLNNEQWQALIALHRTLLHEHHDFFLASQHPSASPALRRLASKYAMPARMWRHGIHSFLELLRHRLPASLDHMLAFIYLAYSMMALLYETVPAFEDTWIECLGDLGRYRMAIEDDDIRDREVWTGVARHWYSKASDKAPTTGRLYHHLAILARPNALQQLFYYAKSLAVIVPFTSARESILTLFEPVLSTENAGQYRLPPLDTAFVKAHGLLFTNRDMEKFKPTVKEFLDLLDNQIGRVTRKFMEQGYYIAVANSVAMLGFAAKDSVLMQAMSKEDSDIDMTGTSTDDASQMKSFEHAQRLSNATLAIVLQRIGDPNVLPFIHVTLVFMFHMARHPRAMRLLEATFPWEALVVMLNTLLAPYSTPARIESTEFPLPIKDDVRPFTEDFAMRGLLWADGYYPEKWFANDKIDDEEKYLEVASMTDDRKERILWLACRISASLRRWIFYDSESRRFATSPFDQAPISRSSTVASATTVARSETWPLVEGVSRSSTFESGAAGSPLESTFPPTEGDVRNTLDEKQGPGNAISGGP